MANTPHNVSLVRRPEVLRRCAISNSTLHRLINAGDFPAPIQISPRAVAWVASEIDRWIDQRIEDSHRVTSSEREEGE
ncbi:helix-turn-helix transcriptional regulator [Halomonas sp. B23F22_10]|uniref:helix-turn-helix transcriptional regulator n=1 Tax=Halomonas sp. B23F22_10 TaxID=3459515 RepID=UPI00373E0D80